MKKFILLPLAGIIALTLFSLGCLTLSTVPAEEAGEVKPTPTPTFTFTLQSSSITANVPLDAKFYGTELTLTPQNGAQNVSPSLSWNKPTEANGYLIVMYDTFSGADNWIHWIRTEDGSTLAVSEEAGSTADSSKQYPTNSSNEARYAGPQPPFGSGSHTYVIKIFALSNALSASSGVSYTSLKPFLNKTTGEDLLGATIVGVSSISANAAYLP